MRPRCSTTDRYASTLLTRAAPTAPGFLPWSLDGRIDASGPCPGGVRKREFELRDGWSSVQLRSERGGLVKSREVVVARRSWSSSSRSPRTWRPRARSRSVAVLRARCVPGDCTVLDLDRAVKAGDRCGAWASGVGDRRCGLDATGPSVLAVKSAPRLCGQSRLFRAKLQFFF